MVEERKVEFAIPAKDLSGEIRIVGEEISATWYEWHGDDSHRVLLAMGKALGYPVIALDYRGGNGHMSAKLRRATPEEAAIQTKIAACPALGYWDMPPYKRLEAMRAELGDALVHVYEIDGGKTVFAWTWVVDTSKVDEGTFFGKWAEQLFHDCLEAARAENWLAAQYAATIAYCYAPRGPRYIEAAALLMLAEAKQLPERGPDLAEGMILTHGRSYGLAHVRELQEQINRFRELFGFSGDLPDIFNVKKVVRGFLEKEPERRGFEHNLVEIAESE